MSHMQYAYTRADTHWRTCSHDAGDLTNCNVITANLFTRCRIAGNMKLPPCTGLREDSMYLSGVRQAGTRGSEKRSKHKTLLMIRMRCTTSFVMLKFMLFLPKSTCTLPQFFLLQSTEMNIYEMMTICTTRHHS